jgi:hypothetical protein
MHSVHRCVSLGEGEVSFEMQEEGSEMWMGWWTVTGQGIPQSFSRPSQVGWLIEQKKRTYLCGCVLISYQRVYRPPLHHLQHRLVSPHQPTARLRSVGQALRFAGAGGRVALWRNESPLKRKGFC